MSDSHDSWPGPFGALPEELPENTPTLETILSHVSIRHFRNQELPDNQIALLHEAIRRAPTSSAMQSTMYITVTDRDLLQAVRPHVGNQEFIGTCGAFLVGCMDPRHLARVAVERDYPDRSSDFRHFITSLEDISISLQNAALAAESLGLGTVMVGGTIDGAVEVANLLALPQGVIPMLGLAVGVPAIEKSAVRPRLPRPVVFHRNRYSGSHASEIALLKEHDREVRERGYYDNRVIAWAELGMPGEDPVCEEDYGWQEHAARKQARLWWQTATPQLLEGLRRLGWKPEELRSLLDGAD